MKIDIEYDLTDSTAPEYCMFSKLGNVAVHAIVVTSRANQLTWSQTLRALRELAKQDAFGEAMDTAVREMVYSALDIKDESFYIKSNG